MEEKNVVKTNGTEEYRLLSYQIKEHIRVLLYRYITFF